VMSLWLAALGHVMWAASVRWPSHAARAVGRVVNDREGHMDITVDVIHLELDELEHIVKRRKVHIASLEETKSELQQTIW